jgi:uncharacterized membrane protein
VDDFPIFGKPARGASAHVLRRAGAGYGSGNTEGISVLGSASSSRGASRVGSFRGAETHSRSVLKAVSWRTLGTLDTFAISWFMTGRVAIAGSIAGIEVATKIAWYYLHERAWAAVPWGRR